MMERRVITEYVKLCTDISLLKYKFTDGRFTNIPIYPQITTITTVTNR